MDLRRPSIGCPVSICVALFEGFHLSGLSAIAETARVANYLIGYEAYKLSFASDRTREGISSGASYIFTSPFDAVKSDRTDLIIICEDDVAQSPLSGETLNFPAWLERMRRGGVGICAIGNAVFRLARHGLLDRLDVAVPWHQRDAFGERFPNVNIRGTLMELGQPIMTCAGGMATLDFMLHVIARSAGLELARKVADYMVYDEFREPMVAQRTHADALPKSLNSRIAQFVSIAGETQISEVDDLAKRMNISRRQLERLCHQEINCSPAKLLQSINLQRSRALLRLTDKPIREIARECGFASPSHFSQRYRAYFGRTPRRDRSSPRRAVDGATVQRFVSGALNTILTA
ncbi:GlxA family transcriptional regulator [Dongia sp.]|uniref:GlxA family transcriptional regulator n=1 Tax=Dongia sp. TaxID=1977262 RepID=UPI0035B2D18B